MRLSLTPWPPVREIVPPFLASFLALVAATCGPVCQGGSRGDSGKLSGARPASTPSALRRRPAPRAWRGSGCQSPSAKSPPAARLRPPTFAIDAITKKKTKKKQRSEFPENIFFFFCLITTPLFYDPFGKFGPPYLGEAKAAARAALPSPTSACWFMLVFPSFTEL